MSVNNIISIHTIATFIIVSLFIVGCSGGTKTEAMADSMAKAQTDSIKNTRTWNCGDKNSNIIATLKDDRTLIVSGTGAMANYDTRFDKHPPWRNIKDNITNIVFEDGVTSIGKCAFQGFTGLIFVIIPNSVTVIWHNAFDSCFNLTTVTIPNSVKYIGWEAFCRTNLTSVTIPDSVRHISPATFAECKNLVSVTIPNSVVYIGDLAFAGCIGMQSITIPKRVSEIGLDTFSECPSLKSITIQNPRPPATYKDIGIDINNVCLYVPASSIAAYRAAVTWEEFKCVKDIASAPK